MQEEIASFELSNAFYEKGFGGKIGTAPSLEQLRKWLREVHNIYVSSFPVMARRYFYSISIIHTDKMEKIKGSPYLPNESQDSYEKALVLGLKEALEYI